MSSAGLHESLRVAPVIHSLGMVFVPVDESSKGDPCPPMKSAVETLPSIALALVRGFSTRLFL